LTEVADGLYNDAASGDSESEEEDESDERDESEEKMNLRMRMNPRRRSPREFATRIGGTRSGVQLRESPVKTPHGAFPPVEAVSEKYGNPRVLAILGDIRPVGR